MTLPSLLISSLRSRKFVHRRSRDAIQFPGSERFYQEKIRKLRKKLNTFVINDVKPRPVSFLAVITLSA